MQSCKKGDNVMIRLSQMNSRGRIFSFKWNSRQKATKALFVTEYESNLHVNA